MSEFVSTVWGQGCSIVLVVVLVLRPLFFLGSTTAGKRGRLAARGVMAVMLLFVSAGTAPAQTNVGPEQIPPLVPPRPEIPPTFWETNRNGILIATVVGLGVLGGIAWVLSRPKHSAPLPPVVRARRALEELRHEPESGLVLSRISQVLRRFVLDEFSLPGGELTTAEFAQLVESHSGMEREFASSLIEFLRHCDERKFAPAAPAPAQPATAMARALELIRMAELYRQSVAAAAAGKPSIPGPPDPKHPGT